MVAEVRDTIDNAITERLLELAPVMVRTLDGRIVLWTEGMRRLYGYGQRQAVGAVSHALLQTQFPRPRPQIDAELVRRGRWSGELTHRRRNGERLVVASTWSLYRPGGGAALVMEFNHDVTSEKVAEAASQRLAAIVENSQDAIIGKTLDGIVTSWNPGATDIFGYTAEEMIGQPMSVLFPPELLDEEASILARLRDGVRVEPYETTRLRKDGRPIRVALTVSPVRDAEGRIVGASKIARDVTDQVTIRERLKQAETELLHVSRLSEMGQMASTLAHELNQPLSAIANYMAGARRLLTQEQPGAWDRAVEALGKAAEQALRAGEVIRRLRAFVSRGESEREAGSLSAMLEEAAALALIGAKEQGVRVTYSFEPKADQVVADRVQVQQVALNLIRNAVEAMADSPRRELTISTNLASGQARVSVADTGPGLSPIVAARLFEPFLSTKANGMGVGLSISRTIIEAHGGRIWCETNRDGGATFRFTLPRASARPAAHAG